MDRRKLIIGGACLIAAPAIVRYSSLMPVKVFDDWETEWRVNVIAKSKRLRAEYTIELADNNQYRSRCTKVSQVMNDLAQEIKDNAHLPQLITITDHEDIKLLEKMGIV